MKPAIGILAFLLIVFTTTAQAQSILERTKLALKAGNAKGLSAMFAPNIQVGFDGDANMLSSKSAEIQVDKFFKTNPPTQMEPLFQGTGKDGQQYFIGKVVAKTGTFRVSVYWKETPSPAIQSVDFSRE